MCTLERRIVQLEGAPQATDSQSISFLQELALFGLVAMPRLGKAPPCKRPAVSLSYHDLIEAKLCLYQTFVLPCSSWTAELPALLAMARPAGFLLGFLEPTRTGAASYFHVQPRTDTELSYELSLTVIGKLSLQICHSSGYRNGTAPHSNGLP